MSRTGHEGRELIGLISLRGKTTEQFLKEVTSALGIPNEGKTPQEMLDAVSTDLGPNWLPRN